MAEADTETKVVTGTANGTCPLEDSGRLVGTGEAETVKEEEAVTVKKEEDNTGVKEMEEDSKENEKNEDVGKEEDHKLKEEDSKQGKEREEPELEDVKMEEETDVMEEKESKENVATAEEKESKESIETREKEDKESKENIENAEDNKDETVKDKESKGEKRYNKRGKGSNVGGKEVAKKNKVDEKNVKETNNPTAFFLDRPVRERKSVERLVAFIERDPAKDFHIEKGHGTPLKEIPNVAYKLSRKKTDEAFKSLYTILFGRRGKASDFKKNISQFSGFVWHESEEKQRMKLKEKFDKCFKEKLLEFCDALDIPVVKTAIRKEDIVMKLIDFLAAPRAMSDVLISEKQQSSKDRKRKRSVKGTASKSGGASAKFSSRFIPQKRRTAEDTQEKDKKSAPDTEIESEEDEDEENDGPEEVLNHSENENKEDESMEESEEDMREHKPGSRKSSSKKESAEKTNMKKCTTSRKATPTASPKKTPREASSKHSKVNDSSDKSPRVFSRKKKNEETRKNASNPVKSATKEKAGKKVVKGKDKSRGEEPGPSEDELRTAICEILQEVDFNTATFTDILKLLTQHFDTDLISRKSAIKLLIQEELTKLADEEEDNEDDKREDEKDQPTAGQEMEA
ncbi:myb-like protein X isoform X2 [Macadamia integrifolia]|uniref:myb-like protein X isoform X2 n=1 Tax=Macadamia integrifolia TaxID=60698 RepID=UPI001C4F8CB8|nr:myb-like protein X isoform X2 [Macadamia integrifolia]